MTNSRRPIRVGVMFGGRSGEHDVSLRSAEAIMRAMDPTRFEVVPIGITREGSWLVGGDPLHKLAETSRLALADGVAHEEPQPEQRSAKQLDVAEADWVQGIDVVFPALHGPMGEDGSIQGFFELAGIPYVGAGVLSSAVSMDKDVAKRLFLQAGLPVPPWIVVTRKEWQHRPAEVAERVGQEVGYPCFTKPANLGSSVGITKVHAAAELAGAMEEATRHDRKIVIEQGVDARELEISVLGNDELISSVVGEILPANEFYDFDAKYVDEGSELLIPAPITPEQSDLVRSYALQAFRAVEASGMARVDFFLDRQTDRILLNEINTIPGFTAISMYPKLWEASGLPFADLVNRLIELAVERAAEHQGWAV